MTDARGLSSGTEGQILRGVDFSSVVIRPLFFCAVFLRACFPPQLFDEDHLAVGHFIERHTPSRAVFMHRCVVRFVVVVVLGGIYAPVRGFLV